MSEPIELRYQGDELDDIVVRDVSVAHIERMGDFVWIGLYVGDSRITFHVPGDEIYVVEDPRSVGEKEAEDAG